VRRRRYKFGFNNINNLVEFIFKFGSCNLIYDEYFTEEIENHY